MPSLRTEFRKIQPIDSIEQLNKLVDLLRHRGTLINEYVDDVVCEVIDDDAILNQWHQVKNELKAENANNSHNKVKKHRSKKKSKDTSYKLGLSSSDPIRQQMFSLRSNSNGDSLSERGYEYGLSDW